MAGRLFDWYHSGCFWKARNHDTMGFFEFFLNTIFSSFSSSSFFLHHLWRFFIFCADVYIIHMHSIGA